MSVYLVEEIYELVEAIETGNPEDVCEELGDVLFHIFFLSDIFRKKGDFDMADVLTVLIEKMVRRHPHVFETARIDSAEEVKDQWHEIKSGEKKNGGNTSVTDSVPKGLPALLRAYRVSERAAREGFDWEDVSGVMDKLKEEVAELEIEVEQNKGDRIEMEYGDVLFTMVNIARFLKIHPETALKSATRRFEERFKRMERIIAEKGETVGALSQKELDAVWEGIKDKQ